MAGESNMGKLFLTVLSYIDEEVTNMRDTRTRLSDSVNTAKSEAANAVWNECEGKFAEFQETIDGLKSAMNDCKNSVDNRVTKASKKLKDLIGEKYSVFRQSVTFNVPSETLAVNGNSEFYSKDVTCKDSSDNVKTGYELLGAIGYKFTKSSGYSGTQRPAAMFQLLTEDPNTKDSNGVVKFRFKNIGAENMDYHSLDLTIYLLWGKHATKTQNS